MSKISKRLRADAFEYASIMATIRAVGDRENSESEAGRSTGPAARDLAWSARYAAAWWMDGSETEYPTARGWGEAAAMLLEGWSPS